MYRPPTGRELAVLTLLQHGLTSSAIGHRLGVSERTVNKHLERLYRKLSVSNRVSAVVTAQSLGWLPQQTRPHQPRHQESTSSPAACS